MTASPFLAPFRRGIALPTLTLSWRQILPLGPLVLAGVLASAPPAVAQSGEATDGGAGPAAGAGGEGRLADVEAQLEQANQALRERETELASLRGHLTRLEQVNRDAEAARTLLALENAKFVAAIAQERATAQANEKALQDELNDLRDSKESNQTARDGERARLAEELTQARDAAAAARRELAIAQAAQQRSAEDVARLTEASARLEGQIQSQNALHAQALATIEAAGSKLRSEKDALASRLLEVQEKISVLDGQLKAQGRSYADAKMEADATAAQLKADKEGLESSLAEAREKTADVEQRLKTLVETHSGAVVALERLQKDKSELQGKVEAERKAAAELSDRLEQAERRAAALAQRAEESEMAAAADKQALVQELERVKQTGAEERKTLQDRLAEAQAGLGRMEAESAAARTQRPVEDSGFVAGEQLRQKAAGQLADLRQIYKRRGGMKAKEWNRERDRLEAALRDQQSLLAQSLGAASVYRVQRDDTLAKISLEVYGKATRWPEIFAANRHLIENPDRLVPGMALVIP